MAWYETGTISLTNGSTAVTGSGTDFLAGAQVGEALYAPDGRLYEVAAIVSATALTLRNNYLGTTQSGQSYAIIPTQSLVADLAGGVSTLIGDYQTVKDEAGGGKFSDGTVSAPGITFLQDQNNGLARLGTDNVALVTAGAAKINIDATGIKADVLFKDGIKQKFGNDSDLSVYHDNINAYIDNNTGKTIASGDFKFTDDVQIDGNVDSLSVVNQIMFGGNRQLTSELKKAKSLFDPQSFREGHAVVNANINPLEWVDTGSTLPQVLRYSQLAVIGDHVYLFGGFDGATEDKIFRAPLTDPVSGWVDTGGTLPQVLGFSHLSIIGDHVYLFGGNDGANENKIFRAPLTDPVGGWVDAGGTLPQVLRNSQPAIIGDYVYLFGGEDGTRENKIFRAPLTDPVSGWVDTGSTLPQVLAFSQLSIIGDYAYLFGGDDGVNENKILRAPLTDPVGGWVDTGGTLPQVLAYSQLAIIGDYAYLFGGNDGVNENKILRAPLTDPVGGWVDTGGTLPQVLRDSSLAIIGDHVYLFGGNDGTDENKIFRTKLGWPDDIAMSGSTINAKNLPTYADDAAAGTGGLVQGDIYITATGELRVKL